MFGWKPNLFETIIMIILFIISTIVCFPCLIIQKVGFKAKVYSNFLHSTGLEQMSYFRIKHYK